jgi:putative flippase GtrA
MQPGGEMIERRELLRYVATSGIAFLVDFASLVFFVEFLDVHYLMAAATAFLLGTVVSYLLCISVVFKTRRLKNPGIEFSVFWAIGAAGLALNVGCIGVLVEWLEVPYAAAKALAACFTLGVNFLLRKIALFAESKGAV